MSLNDCDVASWPFYILETLLHPNGFVCLDEQLQSTKSPLNKPFSERFFPMNACSRKINILKSRRPPQ